MEGKNTFFKLMDGVLPKSEMLFESQPSGAHFNLPGHSLANLKATIIEQVLKKEDDYRKEREHFFINTFNTFYNGMNKKK